MTYYKVKQDCDQLPISANGVYIGFLIGGELYTQTEINKMINRRVNWCVYQLCFDKIELSKKTNRFHIWKESTKNVKLLNVKTMNVKLTKSEQLVVDIIKGLKPVERSIS